ncbi:MAG TPA: hypothetical protein VFN02_17195, partial [Ktedonobacteraceae bacterium]|nr:hypothetical protein [Ktedonobacteraceae bacterium]
MPGAIGLPAIEGIAREHLLSLVDLLFERPVAQRRYQSCCLLVAVTRLLDQRYPHVGGIVVRLRLRCHQRLAPEAA